MSDTRPCPACPDGNVWGADGPTGKTCPTCLGTAEVNLDGSRTAEAIELDRKRARKVRVTYLRGEDE